MKRVQIRKVAKLGTGHTPSRSVEAYWDPPECTIPWLTLADVWQLRDGSISVVTETKEKISPLGLANSAAVRHPAGTVAFSRTASVGFSCILGVDMATSQDFVTWTCGPLLDARFLLWALRAERNDILGRTQGSTHKTIYMPDIEELSLPLPPIDVQRQTAAFLDSLTTRIDGLVTRKRALIALGREHTEAAAVSALGDWRAGPSATLRQLGTTVLTGPFGSVLAASEYVDGGVPLVNPTHISSDGDVRPDPSVTVSSSTAQRLARHRLREGDLVLGRKGDVGRSALIGAREAGWLCGSDSIAVRCKTERLVPEYLAAALSTAFYRQQLVAGSTGATLMNVNEPTLLGLRLPVRSLELQVEIVEQIDAIRLEMSELRSLLDRQIALLGEHRQSAVAAAVLAGPWAA